MKLFNKKEKNDVKIIQPAEQIKPLEPLKIVKCNICGAEAKMVFTGRVLHKYDIEYYFCYDCEHLLTQEPYWLDEAYNSAISISDTGILMRNLRFKDIISNIIFELFDINASFVDYAGGYGIFTRLMRDVGFDFYWWDKYANNILARGFEYNDDKKIELLCAFEAMEHFQNPIEELDKMFKLSDNVIVSQDFLPYPLPRPEDWWYYCLEHGQHINFYSKKTFEYIAQKYSKNLYSYNDLHLFTSKKIGQSEFENAIKRSSNIEEIAKIKSKMKPKTVDDMYFAIDLMSKLK